MYLALDIKTIESILHKENEMLELTSHEVNYYDYWINNSDSISLGKDEVSSLIDILIANESSISDFIYLASDLLIKNEYFLEFSKTIWCFHPWKDNIHEGINTLVFQSILQGAVGIPTNIYPSFLNLFQDPNKYIQHTRLSSVKNEWDTWVSLLFKEESLRSVLNENMLDKQRAIEEQIQNTY